MILHQKCKSQKGAISDLIKIANPAATITAAKQSKNLFPRIKKTPPRISRRAANKYLFNGVTFHHEMNCPLGQANKLYIINTKYRFNAYCISATIFIEFTVVFYAEIFCIFVTFK